MIFLILSCSCIINLKFCFILFSLIYIIFNLASAILYNKIILNNNIRNIRQRINKIASQNTCVEKPSIPRFHRPIPITHSKVPIASTKYKYLLRIILRKLLIFLKLYLNIRKNIKRITQPYNLISIFSTRISCARL